MVLLVCIFPAPKWPTTSLSAQKRSCARVMLGPSREPREDKHSPDPAEIAPGTVGTCPVPAGAGMAVAGKQSWVSPPVLPSCQRHRGWDLALLGWGGHFSSLPGAHLASALPLSLVGDETRCSCDAGAETLEACEDARREGKKKKKKGFKSEVLAPTISFTSGPADTPASHPGPCL